MLSEGDLIDYDGDALRRVRLVWISDCGTQGAVILVENPRALPELVNVDVLTDDLQSGRARLMLEDPYAVFVADDDLKDSYKAIRDKAWRLIEQLVTCVPDIFVAHRRSRLIKAMVVEIKRKIEASQEENQDAEQSIDHASHVSIYRYIRRYFQRGMTPNALLPDYKRSGGKGKERASSDAKRGRPRKYGTETGINISESIRQAFRVGIQRCYASDKERKWTLRDAYDKVIEWFFSRKCVNDETGKVTVQQRTGQDKTDDPTYDQFLYWVNKDHSRLDIKKSRMGAKLYDKDFRGVIGTSNAEVMGPGDRYQIDATLADVYLVSRFNREWIIGRPVIYVVIDVFSRMIVGLYIGLEGPSWIGAMMALANTAADKVKFCKQFGIHINAADWPCHFLPGAILGDRGEIESRQIDALSNNFNVRIENAASYRADWKGIVESRFRLLPAKFKKFMPGYVEPDFRARGGRDYRLDAVLDLYEFTAIVIECLLFYNNHHEIKTYDKDRDVAGDGVPAIPSELWDWGIQNRSGTLRSFPQEFVQFSLLPIENAGVTAQGIRFRGCYYTCARAMEERWFDRARQSKRWTVRVSYDPRDLDVIYLHDGGKKFGFQVCALTDRSRAYRHLSLCEIEQQVYLERSDQADRRPAKVRASATTDAAVEKIIHDAEAKHPRLTGISDASRVRNIRGNRAAEKSLNRQAEVFRPGGAADPIRSPPATVLPFRSAPPAAEDDYSSPSIAEILGEGADDE